MSTDSEALERTRTGAAAGLRVTAVDKVFDTRRGRVEALRGVDLSIGRGEFVAVLGRSGCGKTTLLRILGGLLAPTRGTVEAGGRSIRRPDGTRDDGVLSDVGMVLQDPNLFPWYTVADNVALPLKLRGVGRLERRKRADELCERFGLGGFAAAYPRELSGGMRQRAALARAVSCDPSVLLMDEPFGALDAVTRDRMDLELQGLHAATGATTVFVTHSIPEAVLLADRVVLLTARPGRVRSIVEVPLARPRSIEVETSAEFANAVRTLRRLLDEDGQP